MKTITVGVNDRGLRIGQYHQRAKLTNTEVRLMLELRADGWGYRRLAGVFECSKRHVRDICAGLKRAQLVAEFREVRLPEESAARIGP